MADGKIAIEFVMRQEDSTLSGVVTHDAGGATRYGIAERWHPELVSQGFFDSMPATDALAIAGGIYQTDYFNPMGLTGVESQELANRLLSFAINIGLRETTKLAQEALFSVGAKIAVDGVIGPDTVAALNAQTSTSETVFLAVWRNQLSAFYRRVVAANPAQERYLDGWLNRVKA